ncbi:hypothetical protein MUU74_02230 [Chryseobacterium daecheongense]|uniref:signal peptidase n=1 Tax=Chryseobacterium daecheongense TaxID=192389 RepID=UPI001FD63AD7|nr:signal peptidase [Chryseobacterium daecheongense]UOU98776.1 hypothetical protein MUU74_02230 [Chryseobacterium daecheongense]
MKTINKLVTSVFFLAILFVNAQPPNPGGGGGGVGPGAPAAPINMYVYALSAIAILFIVFFATKIKRQKI